MPIIWDEEEVEEEAPAAPPRPPWIPPVDFEERLKEIRERFEEAAEPWRIADFYFPAIEAFAQPQAYPQFFAPPTEVFAQPQAYPQFFAPPMFTPSPGAFPPGFAPPILEEPPPQDLWSRLGLRIPPLGRLMEGFGLRDLGLGIYEPPPTPAAEEFPRMVIPPAFRPEYRYLPETALPMWVPELGPPPEPPEEPLGARTRETLRRAWESWPIRTVRQAVGTGITALTQLGYWAERGMGELDLRLPFGYKSGIAQLEITREQLREARGLEAQNLDAYLTDLDDPMREFVIHSTARISHSGMARQHPAAQEITALKTQEPDLSLDDPRITEILKRYESPALEMIGNMVFDPLNLIGVGLDSLRDMRVGKSLIAQFATEAADDVVRLIGDLPETKPLREALNPLAETRMSQARTATVNTYDLLYNAISGMDEPGDVIRTLTQWAEDPALLPAELGISPRSPAGRAAQQLLTEVDASKFKTLRVPEFNLLNFLVELDSKVSDAADALYHVEADRMPGILGDYETFTRAVKNYASDIYLGTNPGYVFRNAYNNFVTTAVDGVQSFDRAEDVARFYERLGVELLRAEEGIGSAELFRGAEDIERLPVYLRPFRRLGNIGHGLATGQFPFIGEGWYRLRANYTAGRRFINSYWRFGRSAPDLPDIARQADADTVTMLQRGLEQARNKDEAVAVIMRLFDDGPGINVAKYLDDPENVSPALLERVQGIVDNYDTRTFAGEIDDLINDVMEWETRAWRFEGWMRLEDGTWAYDSGPFSMDDTPYMFANRAGELANKVGLELEGLHFLRRIRKIAKGLELPGAEEITRWSELPAEGKRLYWNRLIDDAARKGIELPGYFFKAEQSEIPFMDARRATEAWLGQRPPDAMTDGRGLSYGDAVMASTERELEFLGRVIDEVPGDVGLAKGPPAIKAGMLAWLDEIWDPAWRDFRLVALKYGEQAADFALLNYNKRRNIDTWASLIFPYHYWYTRTGRNWAVRSFAKPWAITSFARFRNFIEEQNEGLPTRLKRSLTFQAPGALPEWMGNELYVDASRTIWPFLNVWPFSQLLDYNWDDDDEAKGALDQIWNLQRNFQMRPYFFFDLARTLMSEEGSRARREAYYFAPQTAGIKGTSALLRELFPQLLEDVIPPGGWNIEEGVRERLGLPRAAWADEPYWTYMAITEMAAEGEITYEEGLATLKDAVLNGNTENEIYQAALQRAGARKGIAQMTSFWLGQPINVYPVGERIRRGVAGEIREAGWAPERPEGTKAARTEIYEEHPEYGLVQPAREAALGEPAPLERAVRFEEWETHRERVSNTFDPVKQELMKEGIGPGLYAYEVVDDLEGQALRELSEAYPGLFQPRSLYGAAPGEVVSEYQRRLLNALSTAYYFIKPEQFVDAEGNVDWDAFYEAREQFSLRPPVESVVGPEKWPYSATVTPIMFQRFLRRNDTPEEALVRVLVEEVYRPTNDILYSEVPQEEKDAAVAATKDVEGAMLLRQVGRLHPEWGRNIFEKLAKYDLPTFEEWRRSSRDAKGAMIRGLQSFYFSLTKAERRTLHDQEFAQMQGVPENFIGWEFADFIHTDDHWAKTDELVSEGQIAQWLWDVGVAAGLAKGEGIPVPGAELPEYLRGLEGYIGARGPEVGIGAAPMEPPVARGVAPVEPVEAVVPAEEGGVTPLSPQVAAAYEQYLVAMSEYQALKATNPELAKEYVKQEWVQDLFDMFLEPGPKNEFWETYYNLLPPGAISREIREDPLVQAILNPESRDYLTDEAHTEAMKRILAWLKEHPEIATIGNPEEWAQVREIVGQYMTLREEERDDEARALWDENRELLDRYYPPTERAAAPSGVRAGRGGGGRGRARAAPSPQIRSWQDFDTRLRETAGGAYEAVLEGLRSWWTAKGPFSEEVLAILRQLYELLAYGDVTFEEWLEILHQLYRKRTGTSGYRPRRGPVTWRWSRY